MLFKLSNLNSNIALTFYLNPASTSFNQPSFNQPASTNPASTNLARVANCMYTAPK